MADRSHQFLQALHKVKTTPVPEKYLHKTSDGSKVVKVKYLNKYSTIYPYTFQKVENALLEKGYRIRYRTSQFLPQEDVVLEDRIRQFAAEHQIEDVSHIFFKVYLSKKERPRINHALKFTNFYRQMGKGLQRPLWTVYKRARILCQEMSKFKERIDQEDLDEIKTLQRAYGNKWIKMSNELRINFSRINTCVRKMNQKRFSFKDWSEADDEALFKTVEAEVGSENMYRIPWVKIGLFLNKSPDHCRYVWLNRLSLYMRRKKRQTCSVKAFTRKYKIRLLEWVLQQNVCYDTDLDFEEALSLFKHAPSPQYLRLKWSLIKHRIPHYHVYDFDELKEKVADILERLKWEQKRFDEKKRKAEEKKREIESQEVCDGDAGKHNNIQSNESELPSEQNENITKDCGSNELTHKSKHKKKSREKDKLEANEQGVENYNCVIDSDSQSRKSKEKKKKSKHKKNKQEKLGLNETAIELKSEKYTEKESPPPRKLKKKHKSKKKSSEKYIIGLNGIATHKQDGEHVVDDKSPPGKFKKKKRSKHKKRLREQEKNINVETLTTTNEENIIDSGIEELKEKRRAEKRKRSDKRKSRKKAKRESYETVTTDPTNCSTENG